MKPFEFENRLTIKVTPNQIHKIMDKIRGKIGELKYKDSVENDNLTTFTIKKLDVVNTDTNSLSSKLENEFTQRYKEKKFLLECQEDLLSIKEALFRFNVTHNVSQKLSQIEILKHKIRYYQNFKECLVCEKNIKSALDRAKEFLENSDNEIEKVDVNIILYNYKEVKNLLKEANKEILSLEKEITLINASNEIEISISQNIAELVGLG